VDLTGDGAIDVATACSGGSAVEVLLGEGDGGWGAPAWFPTGATPWAVAAGDFDGDSRVDLAAVNRASGDLAFLWGEGVTGAPAAPGAARVALQVGPNPFSESLRLSLAIPGRPIVSLRVHDVTGRLVARLFHGQWSGTQAISWDGRDEQGQDTASGVYFVRAEVDGSALVRKVSRRR
jgi:hypothetical protein